MQVFIVGSPFETAKAMAGDTRRYNKQIIEARIILDALNGAKAWSNHPCVLQYRGYERWLDNYMACLTRYYCGELQRAKISDSWCNSCTPIFHTQEYYDQMKRRLYTKDPEHYKQWADLGTSEENWYFVDGSWRKYVNGKRVE